ncbi:MAG: formylglycine-generating enzyme family protein, partial [Planctomycetes bacterium]|nr:formylglycine-generating enzyme family protein [Planctomycetota bacterium]
SPPEGVEEALTGYERLAGSADPAALRWRERLARVRAAQQRAATALAAVPPPDDAGQRHDELAALVGADDAQAVALRRRLAAVAALRSDLATALAASGPPEFAPGRLAAAERELGGDDPAVKELGGRLARWRRVQSEASGLYMRWALDTAGLEAMERLYTLDAPSLAGADHPQVRRWQDRLAELRGPPPPAWAAAAGRDLHGPWIDLRMGGAGQRLRWLPPGVFRMGSPPAEQGRGDEPQVTVLLTRGIWLADSECGNALWRAMMGDDPSRSQDPALPVEQVDAAAAEAFCAALGRRLGAVVRLPSEAEWEAGARAGVDGPWPGIDPAQIAGAVAHRANAARPWPPTAGPRNALGLHGTCGNLWEWCRDGWGPLPAGDQVEDPVRPPAALRTARGGSWGDDLARCRVASRTGLDPRTASCYLGFRFAVEP